MAVWLLGLVVMAVIAGLCSAPVVPVVQAGMRRSRVG